MRVSVALLLFFVFFNAGAQILFIDTGVADDLGLDPELGETDELDSVDEDAEQVQVGSGFGETLFGLYNALSNTFSNLLSAIFPGARLLKNAGFPDFWIDFVFVGVPVFIGLDTISFMRGWDLL